MTHEETKQAIAGFTEFFKGITGNQDMKIPNDLAKQYGIEQQPTSPCDVCRFNPPSSTDGKPCSMCPAERRAE